MKGFTQFFRLLLASCACLIVTTGWSKTEVNVQTAGTLSSLISTSEKELKVTGFINGSDIKFIRQLIEGGITATIRASRGEDIFAACGLLAGKHKEKP